MSPGRPAGAGQLQAYNHWLDDPQTPDIQIEIPLKCIRSYKPLALP